MGSNFYRGYAMCIRSASSTLGKVWLHLAASISIVFGAAAAEPDYAAFPLRIEVLSVPSKTFTGQDFLKGGAAGRDVVLAGELRLPFASYQGKVPAVVLIHGSGGIGANSDAWARFLNAAGIAVFILDSFSARGIVSTVEDQTQLDSVAMMYDAYRALDVLAAHRAIRPDRIAVMGFSKGAVAAVFSSATRFKTAYGSANTFVAHVGMYTPCNARFEGDTKVSPTPIRLFHGVTDDYVSVVPCRSFVAELKAAGADVSLTEFPDTWHLFDGPNVPSVFELKKAQTTRNCQIKEGPGGVMLNSVTKMPFAVKTDACVEYGTHIGYNPVSAAGAQQGVLTLFKKTLLK
jgi:dienelactone hydrolase